MLHKQHDRFLFRAALSDNRLGHAVGGSVEFVVGQRMVFRLDRRALAKLASDFFEALGNRLLDLFLSKLHESSARVETSGASSGI